MALLKQREAQRSNIVEAWKRAELQSQDGEKLTSQAEKKIDPNHQECDLDL